MNYELFMAEAIAEARRGGEEGETPVGAVAVLDDAMIARDHDRMTLTEDPTAHAVLLTVQAAARKLGSRRLSDVTIFTTHEPCPMCVGRSSRPVSAPSSSRCRTSGTGPPDRSPTSPATLPCRTSCRSSAACASPRRDASPARQPPPEPHGVGIGPVW